MSDIARVLKLSGSSALERPNLLSEIKAAQHSDSGKAGFILQIIE